jgi:hypothetical protein
LVYSSRQVRRNNIYSSSILCAMCEGIILHVYYVYVYIIIYILVIYVYSKYLHYTYFNILLLLLLLFLSRCCRISYGNKINVVTFSIPTTTTTSTFIQVPFFKVFIKFCLVYLSVQALISIRIRDTCSLRK